MARWRYDIFRAVYLPILLAGAPAEHRRETRRRSENVEYPGFDTVI